MSQPATAEEAAQRQKNLWRAQEAGEHLPKIRSASMKEGYELRSVPHHGMGLFPVNVETGEVCECKMQWYLDSQVLLCPVCFLDGT